jgi:hypothetical protein
MVGQPKEPARRPLGDLRIKNEDAASLEVV